MSNSTHSTRPVLIGYANNIIGTGTLAAFVSLLVVSFPSLQSTRVRLNSSDARRYIRTETITVLTRIYGKEALAHHNYSTTINSLSFAGTVVGMLLFGKIQKIYNISVGLTFVQGIFRIRLAGNLEW